MRITKKRSPRLILQSLVKNGCPYIIICIWCVLSGGCVQNKSQDSLKTLKTEIRHIIKDKKATIGVALILDGEDTLAINNAEKYPMMSVYKFHLNPEKPDVPLNKNDAFQKVQKRRVQEKR